MKQAKPVVIHSVSELHRLSGLSKPANPLITVLHHSEKFDDAAFSNQPLILNFYNITIKKSFRGQMKYGKTHYDFDEGSMSFIAPKQVLSIDKDHERNNEGWSLLFHPDLIRLYPLGKAIKTYGFFSYGVAEALHLSDEEEKTIEAILQNIEKEISSRLDDFSQDVIVSNLDLLLSYCNRFYKRQFLTRKMATNDLLTKFEFVLDKRLDEGAHSTLPTVQQIAGELKVSAPYLSDMLRNITGQNTQQHIHNKIIEKAKEMLTTTELNVSEIAYCLGFEYPQSFSKLFKNKTRLTPLEFRASFN